MSKANKSARDKVSGGVNWWDFLTSIRPKGFRNTPQYLDIEDIKNKTEFMKIADKLVKKRKRNEKKLLNNAKFNVKTPLDRMATACKIMTKPTKKAKQDMIKYGLDLANWWGEQGEI